MFALKWRNVKGTVEVDHLGGPPLPPSCLHKSPLHCRAHEAANEARKLTPAARREKTVRKLNEDTSMGVHISLYQVKDLHHPQKQYKVDVNARQLYMTGNLNLAA